MKTIVYIDGFNLYFGSLKSTPYRWLDIVKLTKRICHEQNPDCKIAQIKYFTADIKAKLSKHGHQACIAQQDYLLALNAHSPQLAIIKGKYNIQQRHCYAYQEPVDFTNKHAVWQAEEKQTDVSIAVHALCDVIDAQCEQIVIFSNDSDLSPALERIKTRLPNIVIGIVAPIRDSQRQPSAELIRFADWARSGIKALELKSSILPDKIPTRKRIITKPEHW